MSRLALLALAAGLVLPSCRSGAAPGGEPRVEVVTSPAVHEFYERANAFYAFLQGRRFNSLLTFRDDRLRDYFESDRAFSDYYADLAQDLVDSHFERNRPVDAVVEEFRVEGPGRARVRIRMVGRSALPLRWWNTELIREDRWERRAGRWWIIPGRL